MACDVEAKWTEVTTDFDPEEETANFGTRHALEASGNLYEVVTVATIEPNDRPASSPSVRSFVHGDLTVVIIDTCVNVLSADCQNVFSLVFPSHVDAVAVSPCQRFLVSCLRSGSISLVYLPARKTLKSFPLTEETTEGVRTFVRAFFTKEHDDAYKIAVVSQRGAVFFFTNVQLETFCGAMAAQDLGTLQTAQASVQRRQQDFGLDTDIFGTQFEQSADGGDLFVSNTGQGLARHSLGGGGLHDLLDLSLALGDADIVKVELSRSAAPHQIFCLDSAGQLHVVCKHTLLLAKTWSDGGGGRIEDFALMEDDASADLEVLVLYKGADGANHFQIREYPGLRVTYSLRVSDFAELVAPGAHSDMPLFLEGSTDELVSPGGVIQRLRLRAVTEEKPDVRLQRLIRRCKFQEADSFASTFNLDKEPLYQAKANAILSSVSCWRRPADKQGDIDDKEKLEELKGCLGQIADLGYLVEFCVRAALPSIGMTKELLLFARQKIQNNINNDIADAVSRDLMIQVSHSLKRLETFQLTHSVGSMDVWIKFSQSDLLPLVKSALAEGHMSQALVYWTRHNVEFRPRLDPEEILDILQSIPKGHNTQEQLLFLKRFLSDSMNLLPQSLPVIARWACQASTALEITDRKEWPQNGLSFATSVLDTLQVVQSEESAVNLSQSLVAMALSQQISVPGSPLSQLIGLVGHLKDLEVLHRTHRVRIKLSEFAVPDKFAVVGTILDWLNFRQEIGPVVEGFLLDYMFKSKLDANTTLAGYMTSLLTNTRYTWHGYIGDAPWEEKVAGLLAYVTSVEDKLGVVLEAVKQAPVPWSATVRSLYQLGVGLQHKDAFLVEEQALLVTLKTILRKYECKNCRPSGRSAERLIQKIFKHGKPEEALDDAMEVAKVLPDVSVGHVRQLHVEHLVLGLHDSAAAIRYTVQMLADSWQAGLDIVLALTKTAQLATRVGLDKKAESVMFECVRSLYMHLEASSRRDPKVERLLRTMSLYMKGYSLKAEFGIKTQGNDCSLESVAVVERSACLALLESFVSGKLAALGEDDSEESRLQNVREIYSRVKRLCDLLSLPQEEGIGTLALYLAKSSKFELALKVASMLSESAQETGSQLVDSLYSVIYRLEGELARAEETSDMARLISELTKQAITGSSDSSLVDQLGLLEWQNLSIQLQQESHNTQAFNPKTSTAVDVYENWVFTHQYKDKGLPVDKQSLLPVVNQCMQSLLPLVDQVPLPYLPRSSVCSIEMADLDVTAPNLEVVGNGLAVDQLASSLTKSSSELVGQLQMSGHPQLAFSVLQMSESPLASLGVITQPDGLVAFCAEARQSLVAQLVQRVLAEPKADLALCLGLLMAESKRNALLVLAKSNSSFGHDFRKVFNLARAGIKYCAATGLMKQEEQFRTLYLRACWGMRMSELGIPFDRAFAGGLSEQDEVFQRMITHDQVDLATVLQYLKAFGIFKDNGLLSYSMGMLKSLEPTLDAEGNISVRNFGQKIKKVEAALAMISEDLLLYNHLEEAFKAVSPYNYEVLQFVIKKIQATRTYRDGQPGHFRPAEKFLGFLLHYKRCSEPEPELEVDKWLKERSSHFPDVAKLRLPLSLISLKSGDKYNILEKELNMTNYRSWVEVCSTIDLKASNVCIYTVKNTVKEMLDRADDNSLAADKSGNKWQLSHVRRSTLESINECLESFNDLEKATACASWVVNRLPKGADKIFAADYLLRCAGAWSETEPGSKSLNAVEYARKTLRQLRTEKVLYAYKLTDSAYLDLVQASKPLDLIHRLFEDPSIEARYLVAAGNYPNIFEAARELADINELSISEIKYHLLDKWLPAAAGGDNLGGFCDETLTNFELDLGLGSGAAAAASTAGGGPDTDRSSFLRCFYLLQSETECDVEYLIKYAFSVDPLTSTGHKLRALRCLFSICSPDNMLQLTGHSYEFCQEHVRDLVFLKRLEELNLPYSLASLKTCSKPGLVEAVWRSCKNNPLGVTLARDLCVEFEIWSGQMWSVVLQQMTQFGMAEQLAATLSVLNAQPHLWNSPQFVAAWNFVLMEPFRSAVPPVSCEAAAKCKEAVRRLHECPTAGQLDLSELARQCVSLGLGELAVMVLPYLPAQEAASLEAEVSVPELGEKLAQLQREGFPTVDSVSRLMKPAGSQSSAAL